MLSIYTEQIIIVNCLVKNTTCLFGSLYETIGGRQNSWSNTITNSQISRAGE